MATPSRVKDVKVPHPAGITAPVNEKPNIVEPPADTVNPASAAEPPAALEAVVPSTLNWNPAISVSELYRTSPSKRNTLLIGKSQPSSTTSSPPPFPLSTQ